MQELTYNEKEDNKKPKLTGIDKIDGENRHLYRELDKKLAYSKEGRKLLLDEALKAATIIKELIEKQPGERKQVLTSLKSLAPEFVNDSCKTAAVIIFYILKDISLIDNIDNPSRYTTVNAISKIIYPKTLKGDHALGYTAQLVEYIIENSDVIEKDTIKIKSKDKVHELGYYKVRDDVLLEIKGFVELEADGQYFNFPTTERPIDWQWFNGSLIGGYCNRQIDLVINRSEKEVEWTKNTPHILEALNAIQSVPYKINKTVLEAFESDFNKAPKPNTKDKKEVSKWSLKNRVLEIAKHFQDKEKLYFPHHYDYRGRIYCATEGLSLQGIEESKALLELADGEYLTESGLNQMYAYLASVYGEDKKPFAERVERGKKLYNTVINYNDVAEPYMFLQVKDNLDRHFKGEKVCSFVHFDGSCNGLQHLSALTVCSTGIVSTNLNYNENDKRGDIYSEVAEEAKRLLSKVDLAVLINRIGAKITATKDNQYNEALIKIKEALNASQGQILSTLFEGKNGRKVAKRPTMIKPYGGTIESITKYVKEEIEDLEQGTYKYLVSESESARKNGEIYNPITWLLSKTIAAAINSKVSGANSFEKWIKRAGLFYAKKIQNQINDGDLSGKIFLEWETPDGFRVQVDPYAKTGLEVSYRVYGKLKKISLQQRDKEKVNEKGIVSSISPNVIHSLDATHLRETLKLAHEAEINKLWFIHDSFGCHPNYGLELQYFTRKAFQDFYIDEDKVADFTEQFLEKVLPEHQEKLGFAPVYNERTSLNYDGKQWIIKEIIDVISNEYFFS